ncbi:hypothetical protein [Limosilactobacillus gastricus]|uniref:hypothetical protein n=1 Tax=Limosilactobacillus gastricus TaxID=227942 RepID=UPI0002EFCB2F|nr:hypothetical protein [Limosilactobacillus gastricus]
MKKIFLSLVGTIGIALIFFASLMNHTDLSLSNNYRELFAFLGFVILLIVLAFRGAFKNPANFHFYRYFCYTFTAVIFVNALVNGVSLGAYLIFCILVFGGFYYRRA